MSTITFVSLAILAGWISAAVVFGWVYWWTRPKKWTIRPVDPKELEEELSDDLVSVADVLGLAKQCRQLLEKNIDQQTQRDQVEMSEAKRKWAHAGGCCVCGTQITRDNYSRFMYYMEMGLGVCFDCRGTETFANRVTEVAERARSERSGSGSSFSEDKE
jgi:hypothetical protein